MKEHRDAFFGLLLIVIAVTVLFSLWKLTQLVNALHGLQLGG